MNRMLLTSLGLSLLCLLGLGSSTQLMAQTITLTTSRAVGQKIKLGVTAEGALSIDGVEETPIGDGATDYFHITKQTITITGAVTEMWCANNYLTSIDLSQNGGLTFLDCYNNNLTTLDISNQTNLENVYFSNNQITSINFPTEASNLRWVECQNNLLSSEVMGAIIEALPMRDEAATGKISLVSHWDSEQNVVYKSQVAKATAKNWECRFYDDDAMEYAPYEGQEDPSSESVSWGYVDLDAVPNSGMSRPNGAPMMCGIRVPAEAMAPYIGRKVTGLLICYGSLGDLSKCPKLDDCQIFLSKWDELNEVPFDEVEIMSDYIEPVMGEWHEYPFPETWTITDKPFFVGTVCSSVDDNSIWGMIDAQTPGTPDGCWITAGFGWEDCSEMMGNIFIRVVIDGIQTPVTIPVVGSSDEPVVYYDLMGRMISADTLTPGLYIKKQGNVYSKVLVANQQ